MPGIAGIIGQGLKHTHTNRELISRMIQRMKHENFYYIDTYADENIALGITAITDNKIAVNTGKTLVAVIEGEVGGAQEHSQSILSLYEKQGIKFLDSINGWFNIAIYDCRGDTHTFLLITDRYGFKPLYYTEVGEKLIFASEIKAILAYTEVKKEIDPIAVAEFAIFNYPLRDRTFVKNIQRVPPASIWEWKLTPHTIRVTKTKYWEISELGQKEMLSGPQSIRQGGEKFNEIVNKLMKENSILTLTAGYDTRAILSASKKSEIKCFTFGNKDNEQVIIARKLAQLTGKEHEVKEFGADFTDKINQFWARTAYITDGLCNIGHCGLLYVFSRGKLPFTPTYFFGYGGSELIRGLQNTSLSLTENAKKMIVSNKMNKTWLEIINNDESYGFFSGEMCRKFIANYQLPINNCQLPITKRALFFTLQEIFRKYYAPIIELIRTQVQVRLPYMTHEFIEFILRTPYSILHTPQFSNNPFQRLKGQKFSANIIKENNPELLYIPTDRGYKPYWNLRWHGYPIIYIHQIKNRLCKKPIEELTVIKETGKKILDLIVSKHDIYYNIHKIKKTLYSYPNWSDTQWQEVSKLITFELWRQQVMGRANL